MSDTQVNALALELFERSLDQPNTKRAEWIAKNAPTERILHKALRYLRQDMTTGGAIHTGGAFTETLDDTAIPDQIGAYRITKLIGRGGMGAVYRGERAGDDFEHNVAIKVIRPGALSEKLVTRFQTERQTLAKLVHPHIARLYDGGTLSNGAPYIIMEFIDGLAITKWAKAKNLSQTKRLRLFKDVCDAVSHAHQNLIIHRDITPSNVLVDNEGQVKLIDFGIAKPYVEDAAIIDTAHSLDSLSFTPGFAAPERSAGAGANTLSDIYSLGRLLNSLVDGHKSFELNAIVTKATNFNPSNRYETASALGDEIDLFIAGYPVEAVSGGPTYKFRKYVVRHKLGVFLASAAVTALVFAFGATLFQYREAETARVDADRRFNDVRNLATSMMTDIHAEIYRVPGSTQATKKLVEVAQNYLDDLMADPRASDELKREAAVGYTKLGTMVAGSKGGNINDLESSDRYFAKANAILETLDNNAGADEATLVALGRLYFHMSEISILPRQRDDLAWDQLQTSMAYLDRATKVAPESLEPKITLLRSNCYSAEILIQRQESSRAQKLLRECVGFGADLLKDYPRNENILRVKSAAGRTLANAYSSNGEFSEAIPVLNEAIEDLEVIKTLLDEENDNFTLRALTMTYWRRGYANTHTENYEAALADYAKALEYTNIRLEKDPTDKDANWFYNAISAERATPLQKLGQNEEAEAGLMMALAWYDKRHADQPEDPSRLGNLFIHHYMMGDFYSKIGVTAKECESYEHSFEFFKLIDKLGTASNLYKSSLTELKSAAEHCNINFD